MLRRGLRLIAVGLLACQQGIRFALLHLVLHLDRRLQRLHGQAGERDQDDQGDVAKNLRVEHRLFANTSNDEDS